MWKLVKSDNILDKIKTIKNMSLKTVKEFGLFGNEK